MNQNPYAPPEAPVEDIRTAAAPESCPPQVINAIKLWVANYCLGLLAIVACWEYFKTMQPLGSMVLSQALSLAFSAWMYHKIYLGRNWARVTLLVLCVLGTVGQIAIRDKLSEMPDLGKVQMLIGWSTQVAIIWLLFFSDGRYWFKHSKRR